MTHTHVCTYTYIDVFSLVWGCIRSDKITLFNFSIMELLLYADRVISTGGTSYIALFQYQDHLSVTRMAIIKIRWSWDCLILIMGMLYWYIHLYIEINPICLQAISLFHCFSTMQTSWMEFSLNITMTSQWVRWRLKSPASRLITQRFIQGQIERNIKAPRHWPLWGEFTGDRCIPRRKASNAENVSIWWRHHG